MKSMTITSWNGLSLAKFHTVSSSTSKNRWRKKSLLARRTQFIKIMWRQYRVTDSQCPRTEVYHYKSFCTDHKVSVGAVVQLVEYQTRNREVAGSTCTRSTASNLEQVANLLCAQANSASYPQQDGKWVVAMATGWRPSVADCSDGVTCTNQSL